MMIISLAPPATASLPALTLVYFSGSGLSAALVDSGNQDPAIPRNDCRVKLQDTEIPMSFLEGLLWLTLNIYHEARGESRIGQLAVAHVTLNRAAGQQKSIGSVVLEPYQFSWTVGVSRDSFLPTDQQALVTSLENAFEAMISRDFTGGATFFHRQDIAPAWSSEKTYIAQYGDHKFYRN